MESQKTIVPGSSPSHYHGDGPPSDPAANASLQNTFSKDPEKDVSLVSLLLAVPGGLIYGFSCSLIQNGPFLSAGILGVVTHSSWDCPANKDFSLLSTLFLKTKFQWCLVDPTEIVAVL